MNLGLTPSQLHDFLRQDKAKDNKIRSPVSPSDSRFPREGGLLRQFLHGRAARNGSLIMVLGLSQKSRLLTKP
jgi:hypothetical protein